jgi:hypothetical protein
MHSTRHSNIKFSNVYSGAVIEKRSNIWQGKWTWYLDNISFHINNFSIFFFYYLDCEAIGTAATPGMMECRLAGETEVLGENLPQRHFCPS